MKRQIFIVDDNIKDATGFLLTLYAVLSDHFDKEEELKARFKEIELFYIDILWDERPEVLRNRKEYFIRSRTDVEQHIQSASVPSFSRMNYLPVSLSETRYREQAERDKLAEQVYSTISKKRQDGSPYVILLDIILNAIVDTGEIRSSKDVLSSLLFRDKIDERHCIVYSTYD